VIGCVPSPIVRLCKCSQLDLYTVYAVNAVDEENKDEDEGDLRACEQNSAGILDMTYLHAIL